MEFRKSEKEKKMLKKTRINELKKNRKELLKRLVKLENMIHGSCFKRYLKCGRADCACHTTGEKHGPIMCLGLFEKGQPRQQYVPKSLEEEALKAVSEYNEALDLILNFSEKVYFFQKKEKLHLIFLQI